MKCDQRSGHSVLSCVLSSVLSCDLSSFLSCVLSSEVSVLSVFSLAFYRGTTVQRSAITNLVTVLSFVFSLVIF